MCFPLIETLVETVGTRIGVVAHSPTSGTVNLCAFSPIIVYN